MDDEIDNSELSNQISKQHVQTSSAHVQTTSRTYVQKHHQLATLSEPRLWSLVTWRCKYSGSEESRLLLWSYQKHWILKISWPILTIHSFWVCRIKMLIVCLFRARNYKTFCQHSITSIQVNIIVLAFWYDQTASPASEISLAWSR